MIFRPERWLAWILRVNAALLLCALPAVLLPPAWMSAAHARLGMGDFPEGPLAAYLTRSVSLLYGIMGAATLIIATDVRRYAPLITLWGIACLVVGGTLLVVDLAVEMPVFWTLVEGPYLITLGLVVLWLNRRIRSRSEHPPAAGD